MAVEANAEKTKDRCELCGGAAAVHCAADSALLCLRCDVSVHGANFLAARHQRRRLGVESAATSSSASSASSSSCVSTAESTAAPASGESRAPKRRRAGAEAVLEGWARRVGLAPVAARLRAAAAAGAVRALDRCQRVPLRVAMAAALWSEVSSASATKGEGGDATLLRRLEAAAHVPARLMLTVASWMARRRRPGAEEGWDECSS